MDDHFLRITCSQNLIFPQHFLIQIQVQVCLKTCCYLLSYSPMLDHLLGSSTSSFSLFHAHLYCKSSKSSKEKGSPQKMQKCHSCAMGFNPAIWAKIDDLMNFHVFAFETPFGYKDYKAPLFPEQKSSKSNLLCCLLHLPTPETIYNRLGSPRPSSDRALAKSLR